MSKTFANNLMGVQSGPVSIVVSSAYPEPGQASLRITFTDGTVLTAAYWRLIKERIMIIHFCCGASFKCTCSRRAAPCAIHDSRAS